MFDDLYFGLKLKWDAVHVFVEQRKAFHMQMFFDLHIKFELCAKEEGSNMKRSNEWRI